MTRLAAGRVTPHLIGVLILAGCASAPRPASRALPYPARATSADAVPRAEPRSDHGNPPFYEVGGRRFTVLASAAGYAERGVASWYGPDFDGHSTSSGERYDMYAMTAAHKTLPLPCYARVTNLANGHSVVVRINDRGPFVGNRLIDLSYSAALRLDVVRTGTAFVEVRTLEPGELTAPSAVVPGAGALPISAPPPAEPVPPSGIRLALYLQVGAYGEENHAHEVMERLRAAGVPGVLAWPADRDGRRLQRVRVGPIATVEEFDRLAAQLSTLGFADARLASD